MDAQGKDILRRMVEKMSDCNKVVYKALAEEHSDSVFGQTPHHEEITGSFEAIEDSLATFREHINKL